MSAGIGKPGISSVSGGVVVGGAVGATVVGAAVVGATVVGDHGRRDGRSVVTGADVTMGVGRR